MDFSIEISIKEKVKSNNSILEKIKSKYILEEIFDYLIKSKSLDIIKYNKKTQSTFDINFNTYKEFSEKYSAIELEIIPVENKYNEFINLTKKEKPYYHIYFNDEKKEIKRYKLKSKDKEKKIKIKIDNQIKS